jgi:hypothetical protein
MIQELLSLALPIGKFIIASALMVVFYKLLYRGKSSFNASRFYLLTIAVVSILLSQFNIVVYTPPAKVIEIEAPRISVPASAQPVTSVTTAQVTTTAAATASVEEPTMLSRFMEYLTVRNVAFTLYGAVTLVLFMLFFIQLFKILWYKKKGKVMAKDTFNLVINPKIPTPFSFYKSIFINESITGSKLEMILKHELWHIKHRHFLDVFLIEVIVRIFWFNPVLWWVRRELRNVDEFQTDRSVLDEGHDLYKYQTIILEEVMENNSYLANSFNSSFTKKRFIMMKNTYQTSLATLRRVLYVPFLIVVFSALSFTVGKSEVRYVEKQTEVKQMQNSVEKVESKLDIPETKTPVINTKDSILPVIYNTAMRSLVDRPMTRDEITNSLNTTSIQLSTVVNLLDKLTAKYKTADLNIGLISVLRTIGLNPGLPNNGKFTFSTEFISSITKDDLKNSSTNFSEIKKKIDALKKAEVDTALVNRLKSQARNMMADKLVSKLLQGGFSQNSGIFYSISPPTDGKKPTLTSPKRSIDENINYQSNLYDDLIQRMEKLISANNLQSLREGLYDATNLTAPNTRFKFNQIYSEKFCSTITLDELKNCLGEYRKLKEEIKQLRKLDTDEAKTKGLNGVSAKLWKIDLVRKSSQENFSIMNERNQTIAKDYYKNNDN